MALELIVEVRQEDWLSGGRQNDGGFGGGDFNEVLFGWEVRGRCLRGEWQMRKFREVLQDCDLSDLSFRGSQFTYSNRRKGIWETKVRLDRVVANQRWRSIFPEAEDFGEVVRKTWEEKGRASGNISVKLENCATTLDSWNRKNYGKVRKKISNLKAELGRIKELSRTEEIVRHEARLSTEIDEWLLREELLWRQRSRADWLKEGDRNTHFFHLRAPHRRQVNRIEKLKDNSNEWVVEEEKLCELAVNHFSSIFKTIKSHSSSQLWVLLELSQGEFQKISGIF
ncbi:hypothetical protein QQ045_015813 [Rhodiola kirilowii]